MATPKKTKTAASKTRKPRAKKVVAKQEPDTLIHKFEAKGHNLEIHMLPPEPAEPKQPEVVDPQYTSDEYPPVAPKYTRIQKAWALMWAGAVVALFVTLYMVR